METKFLADIFSDISETVSWATAAFMSAEAFPRHTHTIAQCATVSVFAGLLQIRAFVDPAFIYCPRVLRAAFRVSRVYAWANIELRTGRGI